MPEKTKNQPSSGLVNLAKSLLRGAAMAPQIPGAGLANLLQQIYLNKIMPTAPAQRRLPAPTQKRPRSDLFQRFDLSEIDPFREYGQSFVMSYPSLASQVGGMFSSEATGATMTPEGIRFYSAGGSAPTGKDAETASGIALQNKMMNTPADSLQAAQARRMLGTKDYQALLDLLLSNPNYFRQQQTL